MQVASWTSCVRVLIVWLNVWICSVRSVFFVSRSPAADALTEILETFDITATYDKPNRALALSATLRPDLTAATLNALRPPARAVGAISE